MRNTVIIWLSLCVVLSAATPVCAHTQNPQEAGHPLEMVSYVLHPIGYALHEAVYKPIHNLVSRPGLDKVFGHRPDTFELDSGERVHAEMLTPIETPTPEAAPPESGIEPVAPEDVKQ